MPTVPIGKILLSLITPFYFNHKSANSLQLNLALVSQGLSQFLFAKCVWLEK